MKNPKWQLISQGASTFGMKLNSKISVTYLIGIVSTILHLVLQIFTRNRFQDQLLENFYFQPTSSDDMMQTITVKTLFSEPIRALWYNHYQPPGFDALRLILGIPELILNLQVNSQLIDSRLYIFVAILFGINNSVIWYWSQEFCGHLVAGLVVLAWTFYPGNLSMSIYLDSTFVSATLILLIIHFWFGAFKKQRLRLFLISGAFFMLLGLTRTALHPILAVALMVSAALYTVPKKHFSRIGQVATLTLVILALVLPIKQYLLFSTTSSTTSAGHHLLGMIQYNPTEEEMATYKPPQRIFRNAQKLLEKFNSPQEAELNWQYTQIFKREIRSNPIQSFINSLKSAKRNLTKGAGATQNYQPNIFSDQLPWAGISANIFSGLSYLTIVLCGATFLILRIRQNVKFHYLCNKQALIIPVVFISALTLTLLFGSLRYSENPAMGEGFGWLDGFTWTETNRLKFLLEIFVFPLSIAGFGLGITATVKKIKPTTNRQIIPK